MSDPISGQKTRTFSSLAQAKSFKKKLNANFAKGDYGFFSAMKTYSSLGIVINDYLSNPLTKKHINKKSASLLKRIATSPISSAPADKLESYHWYTLIEYMIEQWNIKPQTAANNLSILSSALKDCVTILRYRVALDSYSTAISTARRKGYIARSETRTRRPTKAELTKIELALKAEKLAQRRTIPMLDIFNVAYQSAARLGEICGGIAWQDLDEKSHLLTIRNRKNPTKGSSVSSTFELSKEVFEIIMRQPRGKDSDQIFPYNPSSVGSAWRTLMKKLEIKDLHFHDLRAEALCRLYEAGWTLSAISKVSGHRSLDILNNFYLRFYPTLPSRLAA
ncbi:site-specific integrase [Aliivibrio sp. 1S128]|uniref:site-specific integrase n=1 Tax=Aliivibrio sp. 1S128 TaxID=1840085 RepID=UPI00159EEBD8|nr:site-specific integrase [Aliivibrio sp. 1S128]